MARVIGQIAIDVPGDGGKDYGLVRVVQEVVVLAEMNGKTGNIVAQPVMVAGVTTARVAVSIEEELSTTEVAQEALVITILPLKLNTSKTVAQPVMAPGIIIALVMMPGEQEPSTTEVVQEAPVIITPQPKLSLSRIVALITVMPGVVIIARTMISIANKPVMTRAALVEAATTIPGQTSS